MAMTLDEIAAVVNAAFPAGAQQFGAALALLDAGEVAAVSAAMAAL